MSVVAAPQRSARSSAVSANHSSVVSVEVRDAASALARGAQYLAGLQHDDGHWCFELEGDSILESEYLLLLAFLGRLQSPLAHKVAKCLADQQADNGGWTMYPGGPVDVSASVKAYFALKLMGHDPASEPMQRAQAAILSMGGAEAVNSFTRFYLAFLGQIPYDRCPAVPPEVLLLPRWFPINPYAVSSWSRAMIVTLSLIWAKQPVTQVAADCGIAELFLTPPATWQLTRAPGKTDGSWSRFFRALDGCIKRCERAGLMWARGPAVRKAINWITERFAHSDGLAAIFPPMVWSIVALKALGHADDSPQMRFCLERLNGLVLQDDDQAWLQPCKSPVWDTALATRALMSAEGESQKSKVRSQKSAGEAEMHSPTSAFCLRTSALQAQRWLLDQEIRFTGGDWRKTVWAEPSGWCFEYANAFYPDVDDTVMVLMALAETNSEGRRQKAEVGIPKSEIPADRLYAAIDRATRWLRAMQNRDGGWGAFDRDNDREFLCHVPFADHNAMLDPSTPDLTGRVLECFGKLGLRLGDNTVNRAVAYLRRTQAADGSWFGRWGVNYIYGTWQGICGLVAVGVPTSDPVVQAAARWLVEHQHPSGGWGESCDTYADATLAGQGTPTPSQTAWAIWGLVAAGQAWHPAVERGVQYLVDTQRPDGGWDEPEFTGTGFPQVFYLRYHGYPIYFPLIALGMYLKARITNV
jgi:squalene-hopene/tetraprenyl-beta-curcumene cyclase